MLRIENYAPQDATPGDSLKLAYDDRKRSRLRAHSVAGTELAILLPRGSVLRDGDRLLATSGEVLLVVAAPEAVSEARTQDALLLSRAAYHLGNRHVPLQLCAGLLRYQPDHVLDDMLRQLGLSVDHTSACFAPETGAYGRGYAQSHTHDHDHDHSHDHKPSALFTRLPTARPR